MSRSEFALDLQRISKTFMQGSDIIEVLRGVDIQICAGESVALLGPSGAGKSTLLHVAALLERVDFGQIKICGVECFGLTKRMQAEMRRNHIGMVYQFHHLMPEFSALENVMIPLLITGNTSAVSREKALKLLEGFELSKRIGHRPSEMSGGEQQRVAIARAIANEPDVLLADEPTGNLDQQASDSVFEKLMDLVKKRGLAAIIATHNVDLAHQMDRVVQLQDGELRVL